KRFDIYIQEHSTSAFQARTYGWSAGMSLSYVMDFQELAIYDCRFKPAPQDNAKVARLAYFHYKEYIPRFDELWEYFGHDAIINGSLEHINPQDKLPRGAMTLDTDFEANLSLWRKELAKSVLRYGKIRDAKLLSAVAQRILDRIIFIRFCEEIGLEEYGTLKAIVHDQDGFWPAFMKETETRWRGVYDGVLFPHSEEDDPTGVETVINDIWIKGNVFKTICAGLYMPSPYCFEVIPIDLLGGIYERYLGKRLKVVGSDVEDEFKPEHQRTRGAVYTPDWVIRRILSRVLDPLTGGKTPADILALKIIDPSCGSGSFLLGAFAFLEDKIVDWCRANRDAAGEWAILDGDEVRLNRTTARAIISGCLHGVDIDPEAIEIARMSLALRCVERTALEEAETPKDLLHGIGLNIRHGNALVGIDGNIALDPQAISQVIPFDWTSTTHGFGAILSNGGFDAVIGNPPYIEVKHYKKWMPLMYDYLKSGIYETAREGKTDIAMPFIEKAVSILKPSGRMGYIVQNRFFRTDYGAATRNFLAKNRLLEGVDDFRDIQVFSGRTTYTAILVLAKNTAQCRYRTYASIDDAIRDKPSLSCKISLAHLDADIWCLDKPDLSALHKKLAERFGTIGSHPDISITVGLQSLWNKVYQLQPVSATETTVTATNGLGEEVTLERAAVRPLCRNRGFYPFRRNNTDAWIIFPYTIDNGQAAEIGWLRFQQAFPMAANYLQEHKKALAQNVELNPENNRWHLYTRPQNLVSQARPKVLFPSTIEDVIASLDLSGDVYQDNVRMQSLSSSNPASNLSAVAAVFNSSLFNALAKVKAGLSDNNWYQFNRQYADRVPLPWHKLCDPAHAGPLAQLADAISAAQVTLFAVEGEGQNAAASSALARLWADLDSAVETLYELSDEDRAIIRAAPRQVDRIQLLYRQSDGIADETDEG
ncbi:MAG TPA: N-6 DNA methylase, partial [Spirochaetota bacterium]|nr:N-6 DNA methylase [Spirochaetota bacterium]